MSDEMFKKCLETGKIKPFSRGQALAGKELKAAHEDLTRGLKTFREGDYKWATVQAYYTMFHSARALLYNKNYRERSHACLIESMREFYVKEKKLGYWFVESMQEAKRLREEADYYGEYRQSSAEKLLLKAKEFLETAKKIIDQNIA